MHKKSRFLSIDFEYIKNAAPEVAYDWIIKNGVRESLFGKVFPDELVDILLEKSNPLINLALAQVCGEQKHLQKLWDLNVRGLQIAIAANVNKGNGFSANKSLSYLNADWIQIDDFLKKINEIPFDREFLEAFCTNPSLKEQNLANLILRKEVYKDISDEAFKAVAYFALKNPNIQKLPDGQQGDEGWDGYSGYLGGLPIEAAWSLLVEFPNHVSNAADFSDVFARIRSFDVPEKLLLEKEIINSENKSDAEFIFLKYLLEKWVGEKDAEHKEKHFSFGLIRRAISSKVPAFRKKLMEYIRDHEDMHVRMGYYEIFSPDIESIDKFYALDKFHFLDAITENEHIYMRGTIRDKVMTLVQNHRTEGSSDGFEDHLMRNRWSRRADEYHAKIPTLYPASHEWSSQES